MRVGCCTITTLRREPSLSHSDTLTGWFCKQDELAAGNHLKAGIQRDWGFEDIVIANGEVRLLSHSFPISMSISPDYQVVNDNGIPGTENEEEAFSGLQSVSFEKEECLSRL